jgi:hypothetical protein
MDWWFMLAQVLWGVLLFTGSQACRICIAHFRM